MDFESQFYPETYFIAGQEFEGTAPNGGSVSIPYSVFPSVEVGATIHKKAGNSTVGLVVKDLSCHEDTTQNIGTKHNHLLMLTVEFESERNKVGSPIYNIGKLTGHNVQLGNNNSVKTNITVKDLIQQVAESSDEESKSKLASFLESPGAKLILGAGIQSLVGLLKS